MRSDTYNTLLYSATNRVTGDQYIGITQRGLVVRRSRHIRTANNGGGSVLGRAIRKYGSDNFVFEPLIICPSFAYAKEMEVGAIKALRPRYNMTAGGDGCLGYRHTAEHKLYVSRRHKGERYWLGKKHSAITIEKMRQSWRSRSRNYSVPIVMPDTGEIFSSMSDAARSIGCTAAAVSWAVKNRKPVRGRTVSRGQGG